MDVKRWVLKPPWAKPRDLSGQPRRHDDLSPDPKQAKLRTEYKVPHLLDVEGMAAFLRLSVPRMRY